MSSSVKTVLFIVIPSNSMVNIQFEKRIACGFQKKRKCKQNFVAQLCVVDLGSLGNSGQMHIAIVLWPNIENLLYLGL